jgi:type I restriction enzyme S subunit
MIRTPNIKGGRVSLNDCRYVDKNVFDKWTRRASVENDDVLLTREAPMGEVGIVNTIENVFLGQRIMQYRANKEVMNPRFLLYSFLSSDLQNQFSSHEGSGSVVSHIRVPDCLKFEINVPPLETQNWIVDVLGSIDDKIELNRQTNQTLEQIAQTIFKCWFVDFEPVKAKIAAKQAGATPEQIERAAMCAINGKTLDQLELLSPDTLQQIKTTAALFPDALVDSELGEIPEGWRFSEIGNEVTVVGGGTPSTKNPVFWDEGNFHWTTPRDMSNLTDKILLETDRKITAAGLAKISSGLLPENTVLMSSRAPVGYLALAKMPVAINQGYIAMKCEGELTSEYVIQWAESVMEEIKQRSSGTTFAEISKKNFKLISVLVPEEGVMKAYTDLVADLYGKITETLQETRTLTDLRDTLLPKLLSGELAVQ